MLKLSKWTLMQDCSAFVAVLVFLFATNVTAAYAQSSESPKGQDLTTQPIEIRSDKFFLDQRNGQAKFSGNVVIVQGEMTISADLMHVEYTISTGFAARSMSKVTASGEVNFQKSSNSAKSEIAIYSVEKKTVTLEGNAEVFVDESVVAGKKIEINLTDDTLYVEGQVQTIFEITPVKPVE